MESIKYYTATLPNGLRVIQLPSSSPVTFCGYQINAGTRNELPGEEGLAHFCEHVTFKCTEKRSAWNILNCLESVGGDINAYTNKEDTVFYAAVPTEEVKRAIDLLTDIVFHSTYPQKEIDKEVEVICDEIESYNDSPADLIYDDFENLLFQNTPLGHNILGTTERVRSFTTADAQRFTGKYYRPDNAIFFIYGGGAPSNKKGAAILKLLHKAFANTAKKVGEKEQNIEEKKDGAIGKIQTTINEVPVIEPHGPANRLIFRDKGTHQAHVMIGSYAYPINDDRRMTLYLLNNMVGGPGMNSRLNIVLREHRGLVYTVESSMVSYSDTGLWCTYLGCDAHDVNRCLHLVHRELDRFRKTPITAYRLRAAKKQLKGQITIACDNRENFALDFGRSFLHLGWERDIETLYQRIDAITVEQIQAVADDIFSPDKLTTLVYR